MPRLDLAVDVLAVVGAVAGEGRHCSVDPVEQRTSLRAIIDIPVGQHGGHNPASVGVGGEVQHPPGPAPLGAVLLDQPFAGPAQPYSRAVHQQVHGRAPRLWPQHLQRLGPTAQGGVVRHGKVETEQLQNGADQPFGLAQRQAEHRLERQGRGDRQKGVARLTAPINAGLGPPRLTRLRREPDRQAAAGAQTRIVFGPVGDPVPLLVNVTLAVGIALERQEGCPCRMKGRAPASPYPKPSRQAIDAIRCVPSSTPSTVLACQTPLLSPDRSGTRDQRVFILISATTPWEQPSGRREFTPRLLAPPWRSWSSPDRSTGSLPLLHTPRELTPVPLTTSPPRRSRIRSLHGHDTRTDGRG